MRDAGTITQMVLVTQEGMQAEVEQHFPVIRVTYPDGSDYDFVRSFSLEDEDEALAGNKDMPYAYWNSQSGCQSQLSEDPQSSVFTLSHADGSFCTFINTVPRHKDKIVGGENLGLKRETRRPEFRLLSINDGQGTTYGIDCTNFGPDHSLISKVTDPSGRYLEFTYSGTGAGSARRITNYAQVLHPETALGSWHEIDLGSDGPSAKFLTLIVQNRESNTPALKVAELEFYDENDGLITGTAFGALPYANPSFDPEKAFDGNTSTFYQHEVATTGYVGIECSAPTKVSKIRYFLLGDAGTRIVFDLAGLAQLNGSDLAITKVTSSDGREVNYTYTTFSDPTGWFNWNVLTGVQYPDGTQASYSYIQTAPFARPLMQHCTDPRIIGNGTSITYEFNELGPVGFVKSEKSALTSEVIASTGHTGPHNTRAIYPSGRLAKFAYDPVKAQITAKEDSYGNVTTYAHDANGFLVSVTDARGFVTNYIHDYAGRPLHITHPDASIETFVYSYTGLLLSHSLSGPGILTRTTYYSRDSWGRVTQVYHPDATTEHWTYNSFGQPLTHIRRNGEVESYTYDTSGRLLTSTDALGSATTYTYNALDLVATITDPLGRVQSFLYNDRGQVTRQTFADGSFVEYDYDDFGNLITQVNELGHFWATTYDEFRNPLTKTDPLNRVTTYSYGDGSPSACGACRSSGKPSAITSPGGRTVSYTYDLEWRLLSETDAFGTAHAATTSYAYDAVGNGVQITDPSGSVTARAFDGRDRVVSVTDALGRTTLTAYDRAGNVISETRPDNGVTLHTYDKLNRRLTTQDAKNQTTTFTYDAEGNLASLTDARGKTYSWLYNALSQPTRKDYPDSSYEQWTYDAAHQRLTARSRNGAVATSSYDLRGRETAVDWSDSTPDITRTFDAAGHLLSSSNGLSTSSYTYDVAGQQLTETQSLHGIAPALPAYTVSYTWDADGRNATVTYPGGTVVSRTYTARGQVETISEGAPPPLAAYSYNPSGTRAGKALENGIVTSYQYDAAHQLTSLNHNLGNTPVQTRAYQYNSVGNRSAMQVDGGTWDVYGFDAVDQITSVKYQSATSTGTSPQKTTTYYWDPVGNRQQVQTTPASGSIVTDTYGTANAVNQYAAINGQSTGYDTNGNLTSARLQDAGSGPVSTLAYDSHNRLLSASDGTHSVTSTYDTRNRVTSRSINGVTTLFLWDGWDLIEERDLSGAQTRRYVHGAAVDEILLMVDATGAKYHLHDALGSVTALTDSTGAILESYQYDVFGKVTVTDSSLISHPSSPLGNRFLYTGREWIAEANLYDYRNRVYSPVIGRFMQIDPIRFSAGDVNMYRYVGNGVVLYRDSSGLKLEICGSWKFKRKVKAALKKLGKDPELKKMIDELKKSENTHGIYENEENRNDSPAGSDHKPSGSMTGWDPDGIIGGEDATGNGVRDPIAGLAHELGHASAADKGQQSTDMGSGKPGTTPPAERQAVEAENRARALTGDNPRAGYYPRGINK